MGLTFINGNTSKKLDHARPACKFQEMRDKKRRCIVDLIRRGVGHLPYRGQPTCATSSGCMVSIIRIRVVRRSRPPWDAFRKKGTRVTGGVPLWTSSCQTAAGCQLKCWYLASSACAIYGIWLLLAIISFQDTDCSQGGLRPWALPASRILPALFPETHRSEREMPVPWLKIEMSMSSKILEVTWCWAWLTISTGTWSGHVTKSMFWWMLNLAGRWGTVVWRRKLSSVCISMHF